LARDPPPPRLRRGETRDDDKTFKEINAINAFYEINAIYAIYEFYAINAVEFC
jgi:hypothetical protein